MVVSSKMNKGTVEIMKSHPIITAGLKYLPGGVKSGFVHVDPDAVEKRLFQVKGKRNIKVRQVDLAPTSMNKEDCFILDLGKVPLTNG